MNYGVGMRKLYGFAMSPNTRRARLGLEEAGLAYEMVDVDLMQGAHKKPEYLALNLTGRVPTLVDGDFVLWESNAILEYAAELVPTKKLGGTTPVERAEIARWMFLSSSHVGVAVQRIFAHTIRLPEDQRIPRLVTEARADLDRSLAAVETRLMDRTWLIGDRLTIADLSILPTLAAAPMLGIDLGKFPSVGAWLARAGEREAFRRIIG